MKETSSPDGGEEDGDNESPPAKRVKLGATSTASAMSLPVDQAESICYGVQLAGMPGKFDNEVATRLGVPRGPIRGQLVRGEDVTLEDGRVVKSSDCVGKSEAGHRFIVVDCPTAAHLAELARPDSPSAVALAALGDNKGNSSKEQEVEGEVILGDLVVVMHLAPVEISTSSEYVSWVQSCAAFRNENATPVRHIMVHSQATCQNPVFRASAAVNSRLHAVDAGVFPEPLFSTQHEATRVKAQLNRAKEEEEAWAKKLAVKQKSGSGDVSPPPPPPPPALIHPAQNLVKFNLMPIKKAGLDVLPMDPFIADYGRRNLDVDELRMMVTKAEMTRARAAAAAADGGNPGRGEGGGESGDEFVMPSALKGMKEGDAEIIFLGTGSSQPAKYRNVTGIFLDQPALGSMFIDVGEGSYGQLRRCVGEKAAEEALLRLRCVWISHIHADHHVGLPTVLAARRALLGEEKMNDEGQLLSFSLFCFCVMRCT